jgi:hypothetical protein
LLFAATRFVDVASGRKTMWLDPEMFLFIGAIVTIAYGWLAGDQREDVSNLSTVSQEA